jgi:hypothetical protein
MLDEEVVLDGGVACLEAEGMRRLIRELWGSEEDNP